MKCEHCGKEVPNLDEYIWIEDASFQGERMVFFCDNDCLSDWWNTPADNPCNVRG